MAETSVKIHGLKELDKALQLFPERIEKNVLRGALRAGLKPIAEEAKAIAPTGKTGALANSIRVRTSAMRGKPVTGKLIAGGRGGKKRKEAFYAHFVEYGTYRSREIPPAYHPRAAAKRARRIARSPIGMDALGARPKPFMRPAFDAKGKEAIEAFKVYLVGRIPKEVAKLPKGKKI